MFVKENPDRKEKKIVLTQIGLFQKKKSWGEGEREREGGGGLRIWNVLGYIKERACGNSRGSLKMKWNFRG